MENYFFNVKLFDWDYLHLTAQTRENYFSQKMTFEYLNFTIWASGPEVFSFSILGNMAIGVVEFSREGYKIRKDFA